MPLAFRISAAKICMETSCSSRTSSEETTWLPPASFRSGARKKLLGCVEGDHKADAGFLFSGILGLRRVTLLRLVRFSISYILYNVQRNHFLYEISVVFL